MMTSIRFKSMDSMLNHATELEQIFSSVKFHIFKYEMTADNQSYILNIKTFKICLN